MGPCPSPVCRRRARGRLAGVWLAVVCVLALLPSLPSAVAEDPVLKPGDVAPDFALPGTDGRTHTLAEHRGVRPVVIAWFPKAFAKE